MRDGLLQREGHRADDAYRWRPPLDRDFDRPFIISYPRGSCRKLSLQMFEPYKGLRALLKGLLASDLYSRWTRALVHDTENH